MLAASEKLRLAHMRDFVPRFRHRSARDAADGQELPRRCARTACDAKPMSVGGVGGGAGRQQGRGTASGDPCAALVRSVIRRQPSPLGSSLRRLAAALPPPRRPIRPRGSSFRHAGDAFSVSDVAVGAYIAYVEIFFPNVSFSQYKNVTRYMVEMKKRPAFQARRRTSCMHKRVRSCLLRVMMVMRCVVWNQYPRFCSETDPL